MFAASSTSSSAVGIGTRITSTLAMMPSGRIKSRQRAGPAFSAKVGVPAATL